MNVTDVLFAALAHRKQVDLQGQPYILHLMTVVLACDEPDRVVAALHDVVRTDTPRWRDCGPSA